MKTIYTLALCLGLIALAGPNAVWADSTFTASGTFGDNSTLSGTLTINTSTGFITGADLTVQYNISPSITENFTDILGQTPNSVDLEGSLFGELFVYIDASTLVGYPGGPLCSTSLLSCVGSVVSDLSPGSGVTGVPFNDFLTSGTLTAPTASTPEPPTAVLLAASLLGLAAALIQKRWA